MGSKVRVDGVDEMYAAFAELPDRVQHAAAAAVEEGAREMRADARRLVHVDTGALQAGIDIRYSADGLEADVGVFADELYYGEYVEARYPFLAPAAEAEMLRAPGRVSGAVRGELG